MRSHVSKLGELVSSSRDSNGMPKRQAALIAPTSVRFRFTYQDVRQRAVRQPAEVQEREHLAGRLNDDPLTIAELQYPDQCGDSCRVHERDAREVDQEVPDLRSHHGFGRLLFEPTCRDEVDLAMDDNTLGSPL